jgi:hypothetical protein
MACLAKRPSRVVRGARESGLQPLRFSRGDQRGAIAQFPYVVARRATPSAPSAGGGFRHGQHVAFDRKNNYPLPNLFVSALQRLGLETEKFASSTCTMQGLEAV